MDLSREYLEATTYARLRARAAAAAREMAYWREYRQAAARRNRTLWREQRRLQRAAAELHRHLPRGLRSAPRVLEVEADVKQWAKRVIADPAQVAEAADRAERAARIVRDTTQTLNLYGVSARAGYHDRRKAAAHLSHSIGVTLAQALADGDESGIDELSERYGLDLRSPSDQRRAIDPGYWIKRISRDSRRAVERLWLALDPTKMRWCSPTAYQRRAEAERDLSWAKKIRFQSDDGQEIGLDELIAARPSHQYAELMARARGLAEIAIAAGRIDARFVTITAPAHMHPTTTVGGTRHENPNWNGADPGQTAKWLQAAWARARARLKKRRTQIDAIIATQLHESGVWHWHLTLFARPWDWPEIESILRSTFRARAQDGADRYRRGIDIQKISGGPEGAVAYASRTIKYQSRHLSAKEGDTPADEAEARATAEAASIWGCRRFRTTAGHIGVYRMLRKLDLSDAGPAAADATRAAREGRYAHFLRARARAGIRLAYEDTENRYGENTRRVIGLRIKTTVYSPSTTWRIVIKDPARASGSKVTVMLKDQDPGSEAPVPPPKSHAVGCATGQTGPPQVNPALF